MICSQIICCAILNVKVNIIKKSSIAKLLLLLSGLIVVAITSIFTAYFASRLAENERNNVILYAKAIENIQNEENQDPQLELQILDLNHNVNKIKIIFEDELGVLTGFNFGEKRDNDQDYLMRQKENLIKAGFEPIEGVGYSSKIYFKNSFLLTLIKWFPVVQVLLILVFIILGYFSLNSTRKAEQNMVWVGMAKETAHQLGTPISAIIGWIEYLKTLTQGKKEEEEVIRELTNDISKLELIADRFSKIGSAPDLVDTDIHALLSETMDYMQKRSSKNIQFNLISASADGLFVKINSHLFAWVIENLLRNALDAMDGTGTISIQTEVDKHYLHIDISDTGKGIPANKVKKIFQPGFSTKKRGWGLGLSLSKRIINDYHKGKIFVKKTELTAGTTFRITLPYTGIV